MEGSTLNEISEEKLRINNNSNVSHGNLKAGGNTELHLAVMGDNIINIKRLIKDSNIDINYKNDLGNTPLHYASTAEIAEILIKNKADVHVTNNDGQKFLDMLIILENFSLLEYITEQRLVNHEEVAKSYYLKDPISYGAVVKYVKCLRIDSEMYRCCTVDSD